MSKSTALLALLLTIALAVSAFACTSNEETISPSPAASPTPVVTSTPEPAATTVPEPIINVHNIRRTLSGLDITLVMVTWVGDEVEIEWRIVNPSTQSFEGSRLYNIFQPGTYATDQAGNEAEYFVPPLLFRDLQPNDPLLYKTKLLFYPESTRITISLNDTWVEGSTFTDISVDFSFAR